MTGYLHDSNPSAIRFTNFYRQVSSTVSIVECHELILTKNQITFHQNSPLLNHTPSYLSHCLQATEGCSAGAGSCLLQLGATHWDTSAVPVSSTAVPGHVHMS